ncbi:hypothetical protein D3C76_1318150 [compost metagenome]
MLEGRGVTAGGGGNGGSTACVVPHSVVQREFERQHFALGALGATHCNSAHGVVLFGSQCLRHTVVVHAPHSD